MQIQDITLTRRLELQKILHETLTTQEMPTREYEYRRRISDEGPEYIIETYVNRADFDALAAACENQVVWVQDSDETSFHATMELSGTRSVDDIGLIRVRISLLGRTVAHIPGGLVFNPEAFIEEAFTSSTFFAPKVFA